MKHIEKILKKYSKHLKTVCRVKPLFNEEENVEQFIEDCPECLDIERVEMHTFLLLSEIEELLDPLHPIKHSSHFKALKKEHGL